jgi:predicted AAA+ superfamily ATPase
LQGRYHYLRLHPLSLKELGCDDIQAGLVDLLEFGGFPEPFLKKEKIHWQRWQNERNTRVLQDDILGLESIKDVSQLTLLMTILPDRVGSLLSLNSLREDLSVAHDTVDRWVIILENIYYCYRIAPFGGNLLKALKKEQKLYLWDWSLCKEPGQRLENLIASHLLKHCHYLEDTLGEKMELRFLRDKEKREIDFVVLRSNKPMFAVECKSKSTKISKHIIYFLERLDIPIYYQIHLERNSYSSHDGRIQLIPITEFLTKISDV